MAASSVTALKANLATALQARPAFQNVQVTYGAPLPAPSREFVWLADVDGDEEPAALGRNRHEEIYTLTVIAQAVHEGQDQQSMTERALLFRDEVDAQLRTDPTVGGATGSGGWAVRGGHFKLEELASDTQRGALLTFNVAVHARI